MAPFEMTLVYSIENLQGLSLLPVRRAELEQTLGQIKPPNPFNSYSFEAL